MKKQCLNCRGFNTKIVTSGTYCSDCFYPLGVEFYRDDKGVYFFNKKGKQVYSAFTK